MAHFLSQSDSIHFFTHHISRTVSVKCKYGTKRPYLSPVVPVFLPLPCKWALSSLYLIVPILGMLPVGSLCL